MRTLVNGTGRRIGLSVLTAAAVLSGCGGGGGGGTVPPQPVLPPPGPTASTTQPAWLGEHVNIGVKNDQPGLNLKTAYSSSGFDLDLAKYLAEKMGFKPNFIDIPSNERESKLTSGAVQLVIASYSMTPDRQALVDFAGPYLKTRQTLLVRSDDNRITVPGDVAKKHICTVTGSTSAAGVPSPSGPTPAGLIPSSLYFHTDFATCVQDLLEKRADAVYTDATILYGFTQLYPGKMKVLPLTFGSLNYYGVGIQAGHQDTCRTIMGHVREFLREKWVQHFRDNLPSIVAADPVFTNDYQPDSESDVDRYSHCT
ncbi:transporter substrate-binding domain-containing protein [Streptomyces sp. CBMA156]|uniref:transporter substrate-binding domain-containing protein n=1 Tax=Streptomyces sp. CBMA156 TaxID=1930280 RepID=UPI0016620774|nr:transporter substrate-binding domain-containing protein [Streptomyces sp. CBMA156]MBD0673107.1 hypothetical protein [Streptomyces sp. CBMA156]